jgi:crotonobetainyl-CoA:carnitine CoA-transferase CaiB-like acyl-CoA transferase
MKPSALGGLRVLDFTHVYQGPVGTQLLADHGADVIKMERPGAGDWSRSWGPFVRDVSLPFANLNRNKRSVAIDLKQPAGRAAVIELVRTADVLLHNFRKGVMEKLGLGYVQLQAINPRLIYAWSSGWGDHGPSADRGRAGHDMMARAEAGWLVHAVPGQPPIPGGLSIDYAAGMNLMVATLMALYHREQTGKGQFVSTDLLSVAFHAHAWEGAAALNEEKIDRPAAVGGTEAAINKAFATADGFIEISPVFSDNSLRDISVGLGLGDLSALPQFATESLQIANRDELNTRLAARLRERRTDEWLVSLEAAGVLCARVNSFREAMHDPQVRANNMVVTMEHPRAGELSLLGTPVRLHGTPAQLRLPPPDLGAQTHQVLAEAGFAAAHLAQLAAAGVIPAATEATPTRECAPAAST